MTALPLIETSGPLIVTRASSSERYGATIVRTKAKRSVVRAKTHVVSPAPQPFWPCSGRNSIYAVVQIRHLSA
jgi:hypothetical protein